MITVKIAGGVFKDADRQGNEVVAIEWGEGTIGEVLEALGLEEKQVGAVLVQGKPKKMNHVVADGDLIQILPILSGG
ncbi:MoaD/ThiS family protein [Acidaminobacter hydrogenoformans]|uniref:Mut7-C ubiquitin n=1 Tax=Acidaminobacter hydrogenoformans DSM 2784 TaxID=1120920 RepID=A0A1G5S054_9FIRM|nr:MoaD/ThiS family protein [Acidaminobacter hydrogenoformans]SCZ79636.1 Mut7-C ubiquitin [Acidaminobacter hydrogenoformans DSM 2784]